MEIVAIIIVAVLAYVVFLGVKFTNFKSKLMNEFGRRGVPFEIADSIFFQHRDDINNLHHSGMPIDQIVDRYAISEPPTAELAAGASKITSLPEPWIEDAAPKEKSSAIVEFVAGTLGIQQALFLNEDGTLPSKAVNNWSIGYVAGTTDAVLQKNGLEPDVEGMAIMALIFMEVFGDRNGPELFADFMRKQGQGNPDVQEGMMTGGRDMFTWMSDNDKVPTGWMAYLNSLKDF